jgi:capsular exopolysaccharide synthesis family protein
MSLHPALPGPIDRSAEPLLPTVAGQPLPGGHMTNVVHGGRGDALHAHAVPSAGFTMANLARALGRRLSLALFLGLVVGGAVFALVWYFSPAQFTATAIVRVSYAETSLLPNDRSNSGEPLEVFQHTQAMLIKSRPIISKALEKAGNASMLAQLEDPVGWVVLHLSVYFYEGTELLNISLTGTNPDELAAIVNAVKTTYLEKVQEDEETLRSDRRKGLKESFDKIEKDYTDHLLKLNKVAPGAEGKSPEALAVEQRAAAERYALIEGELNKIRSQKVVVTKRREQQQNRVKEMDAWAGYSLRLLGPLENANELPTKGRSMIVVAPVKGSIRIRVFDADGKISPDDEAANLMRESREFDDDDLKRKEQALQLDELRKLLPSLCPPHELSATERGQLKGLVASVAGRAPWTPPDELVDQQLDLNQGLLRLQVEAETREDDAARLGRQFTQETPSVSNARREAQAARERYVAARDKLRSRVVDQLKSQFRSDALKTLEQLADQEAQLKHQEAAQLQALGEQRRVVEDLGGGLKGDPILDKERKKLQAEEAFLNTMRAEVARNQVAGESVHSRAVSHQDAEGRRQRNLWKQATMPGLAGGAALLLVVGLVGLWECHKQKVGTEEDVTVGLRIPVLGTVPCLPRKFRTDNVTDTSSSPWAYALKESMDGLRTVLLHHASVSGERVVLVTSAESGEGKTSLVANLALSMARAGRKTLVIDADLRRPFLGRLFGEEGPGLCEVLRGEMPVAEVVCPTHVDSLFVLPAGQLDAAALRVLSQDGFRTLLSQVVSDYDFVIIDSSPILRATEPLLLGRSGGTVVLAVRPDVSRIPLVQSAIRRLNGLGIRILGAVVNGFGSSVNYYPAQVEELDRKDSAAP